MKMKVLSIVLCCILLIGIVAGCAGTSTDSPTVAPTEDATKETAKPDDKEPEPSDAEGEFEYDGSAPITEEPLKISWVCANTGHAATYMDFENMKWIQEILRLANVEIDMEILDSASYGDAIRPRLAAGTDLPDVMQLPSKDEDMTYLKSGMFLELTDLYEKYAVNLSWRFEDNPTVKPQITTPDGKIYYVPVINMSKDYIPNLLINDPWLKELGLSVPTTTDEFYDVLKAFKDKDPNGNNEADELPFYIQGTGYLKRFGSAWGLDLSYSYVVGEDGKLENSYITDRYKNFLEYIHKLHEEGLLNNDFATNTNDMLNERMANNQIGSTFHYINFAHTFALLLKPDIDVENDPLIMTPMMPLQGPYGHRLYYGNDPVAGFFAINKDVENPEAVFCFMDYLFSEEANNLMYYGIEGEDYEVIDGKKKPDLEKRSKDNYAGRMGNNFGGFPRILLAAHRDVSYMPDIAVWNKQISEYNRVPDNISAFWLPEEVDIIQQYNADLNTYLNEMFVKFVTGEVDIGTFDDYVATAKSMGLEELLRIYQARYDRINAIRE